MIDGPPIRHVKQINAVYDKARFKFWLAGRRGGKTVGIREDILRHVPNIPDNSGILFTAPTNLMAKELIWDELRDRLDDLGWKYKDMISTQRFEFSRGRYIQILGAEKIRRVRGKRLFRAYLDEVAFYTASLNEVWRAVRPALSDYGGGAIVSTTPNGKGTQAYDFYLETLSKPDWKYFHWKTIDNPFIRAEEIEAAKRELDEKSFRQEYEAAWESFEGLAYYCFEESLHIKPQPPVTPDLPLALSFDFNVNPTSLLLIQNDGMHRVKKEYSLKNSSTIQTVKTFCEDFKDRADKLQLFIHGDAAGESRKSTTGLSDYHYIREILTAYGFRFQSKVMASNPPIIDRVSHVNSYLKSMSGEHRVEIDPSCTELIRDLSSQPLDGRFPSDKNNLGHKADALGYYINWQHVVGQRRPQETIIL